MLYSVSAGYGTGKNLYENPTTSLLDMTAANREINRETCAYAELLPPGSQLVYSIDIVQHPNSNQWVYFLRRKDQDQNRCDETMTKQGHSDISIMI